MSLSVAPRPKMAGTICPLILHTQQPPRRGRIPVKMELLACERAPTAASAMIHPASFQPRKNIVGWVRDLGRKHLMWQDRENGACTWQAPPSSSGRSDSIECLHPVYCVHFTRWSSHHRITLWWSPHLTMPVSSSNANILLLCHGRDHCTHAYAVAQ